MKQLLVLLLFLTCLFPVMSFAQSAPQGNTMTSDTDVFEKAQVLHVTDVSTTTIPGTDTSSPLQTLEVTILTGVDTGKTVTFVNDYTQLEVGDMFYARHETNALDGVDTWSVSDPYRLDTLFELALLFVVLIFIFGGVQGVRGLASLVGSFLLIFYILIPGIYHGYNAVLVSIGVASLIIIVGSYVTHGFNRTTSSAVISMISTVILTGLLAYYAVHAAHLTGYNSEESTFLSLDTRGTINMVGLLFGGIMIGLLGVLYDIAIGQAIAIEELCSLGQHLSRAQVYTRAIRIGREHIGALVNTLAIAYVGASLPLILLMQNSTTGLLFMLNNEIFSTEIVRILIGSIGLILGVPITTLIASYMLHGKVGEKGGSEGETQHYGHRH